MAEHHFDQKIEHCLNCGHTFAEGDKYCGKCSQKRHLHMSVGALVHEFIHTTLHLDGKFFKMLYSLFLPGKLTNDFLAGKQKRYPHPVRFFVVVSAAFLLVMFKVVVPDFSKGIADGGNTESVAQMIENVYPPVLGPTLSYASRAEIFLSDSSKMQHQWTDTSRALFMKDVFGLTRNQVLIEMLLDTSSSAKMPGLTFNSSIPVKDLFVLHPDSLLIRYDQEKGIQNHQEKGTKRKAFIGKQVIRLTQEPLVFFKSFIGKFTVAFILMMLLQSLFLKLLYWKQKRPYAEHLLFLLNLGTATLLSLMVALPLLEWLKLGEEYMLIWVFGLLFYHLYSLKAVYKQAWGKTLLKFVPYTVIYMTVGIFSMILMAIVSVFLFG